MGGATGPTCVGGPEARRAARFQKKSFFFLFSKQNSTNSHFEQEKFIFWT
jgi:hypothetical protein